MVQVSCMQGMCFTTLAKSPKEYLKNCFADKERAVPFIVQKLFKSCSQEKAAPFIAQKLQVVSVNWLVFKKWHAFLSQWPFGLYLTARRLLVDLEKGNVLWRRGKEEGVYFPFPCVSSSNKMAELLQVATPQLCFLPEWSILWRLEPDERFGFYMLTLPIARADAFGHINTLPIIQIISFP